MIVNNGKSYCLCRRGGDAKSTLESLFCHSFCNTILVRGRCGEERVSLVAKPQIPYLDIVQGGREGLILAMTVSLAPEGLA